MYTLRPSRVYVHRRVYQNPQAVSRMERMLGAMGNPAVEEIDAQDTDRIFEESGPPEGIPLATHGVAQGVEKLRRDPAILFNTFEWDKSQCPPITRKYRSVWHERLARLIAGAGEDSAWSQRKPDFGTQHGEVVCEGGWGIHTLAGCVHKCDYCSEGYIVNVMLDIEDFADHLAGLFLRRPQQKLYRYDVWSDTICFEPEYGASAVLADLFARSGDKYLLFYTKSDNVEHLLPLPKTNSIFFCSLSTETVCRTIERDTPSLDQRIEGLRRCQEAGYPVRVGFSPIIPIVNWQQEATQAIEKLLSVVSPQVVRLWVLSLMQAREFERAICPDLIEPTFLSELRAAAPELENGMPVQRPFPPAVREQIYGHYLDEFRRMSPNTPVGLCTEERVLWDALRDKMTMTPESLFCCCGGHSVRPPSGAAPRAPRANH
ncbi:MAG: hypothetical protein V1800_00425 [Candidatus Latescibacterota bacterium]